MIRRYPDNVTVSCVYREEQHDYECVVTKEGESGKMIYMKPPFDEVVACDSPRAYDDVARAAIHFVSLGYGESVPLRFSPIADPSASPAAPLRRTRRRV